ILTDAYYGVAPAPNGDVWFGGANRSTRFRYMSNSRRPGDYFRAAYETEAPESAWTRLDLWRDAAAETGYPGPGQPTADPTSAMVAMPDDTVWAASFAWGLVHLNGSETSSATRSPAPRTGTCRRSPGIRPMVACGPGTATEGGSRGCAGVASSACGKRSASSAPIR